MVSTCGRLYKVLNIEWDDHGKVELVSFRRGAWELELITLARCKP